ncbi:MAG: hypothetical protein JSV19_10510 [Phycisphaerales bacterium]|nr:MAG: hypothetical protein JSV19_10510 [Phycisphaerales bacterium]
MGIHANRASYAFALVATVMAGSGCSTTTSGGGGTSTSLAEYQLDGSNPELEADVAAIAAADNAAFVCIDVDVSFTDQETLDGLKSAYSGATAGFPAYVADVRVKVERRSGEICTIELGDDPDLDEAVARLTVARNRGRECQGDEPDLDDENSLALVKQKYMEIGLIFDSITAVAVALADAAEEVADDICADS